MKLRLTLALVALLFLTACEPAPPDVVEPLMPPAPGLDDLESRIIEVAGFASPSVVLVRTRCLAEAETPVKGSLVLKVERRSSLRLGSGLVYDGAGLILTTASQVRGGLATFVELPDGRELPATVLGVDGPTDLAVLRIDAGRPMPVPDLAGSGEASPGRWVVAVGGIADNSRTVAHGQVLAQGRVPEGYGGFETFLQTNVTSVDVLAGGPVLTLDGRVLGICTTLGSRPGISYAVPLRTALWIASELATNGSVRRSFLGLFGSSLTPGQAAARGYAGGGAVMVFEVRPETPAARAGIAPGDVLVSVQGKAVGDFRGMQRLISRIPAGSEVRIGLVRRGEPIEAMAALMPAPEDLDRYEAEIPQGTEALIGAGFEALPEGVDARGGIQVVSVDPATPQAAVDLMVGDVVLEADGFSLSSPEQLAAILWGKAPGSSVLLKTLRNGTPRAAAVEVR